MFLSLETFPRQKRSSLLYYLTIVGGGEGKKKGLIHAFLRGIKGFLSSFLVSFLMALISPPSCFVYSLRVVVSMRQRCLQCWQVLFLPFFLDTYSLSTLSLRCLMRVIRFLVLWSICLSSSLVHFRKGPEYLTRGTAQIFIPLIRFRQESFVLSSFSSSPEIFFLNFVSRFLRNTLVNQILKQHPTKQQLNG